MANLKALIVDDDPVLHLIISRELSALGISSESAQDGVEAIEKLKTFSPNFILMDVRMPGQDGIDTVRWIRDLSINQKKDTPIFALTSFSLPEHYKELMEAGFNEHLIKPLDTLYLKKILKSISKIFEIKRLLKFFKN